MIRFAWRLKDKIRDGRYPTPRHALIGRIANYDNRTGWIVYNIRKNRLETTTCAE